MASRRLALEAPGVKAYSEDTPFLQGEEGLVSGVVLANSLRVINETDLIVPYYDQRGQIQEKTIGLPGIPDIQLGGEVLSIGPVLPASPNPVDKILHVLTVSAGINNAGLYYWNSSDSDWE